MTTTETKENDIITANDFPTSDLLTAITIIKDMATAQVAQLPPEEFADSINKFRYTIEFMVDFYDMNSPHFNVKYAILSDFDKIIADHTAEWEKSKVLPTES